MQLLWLITIIIILLVLVLFFRNKENCCGGGGPRSEYMTLMTFPSSLGIGKTVISPNKVLNKCTINNIRGY